VNKGSKTKQKHNKFYTVESALQVCASHACLQARLSKAAKLLGIIIKGLFEATTILHDEVHASV